MLFGAYNQIFRENIQTTSPEHLVFSDGCAGQYKGKMTFYNLTVLTIQLWFKRSKFQLEWHFYGSRHGKGESDGESGCVKSYVDAAIRARGVVIDSAKQFAEFLESEMAIPDDKSQRHVAYIDSFSIDRDTRYDNVVTVKNTRKIHTVKPAANGIILHKRLSRFCQGCESSQGRCTSKYSQSWTRSTVLKKGKLICILFFRSLHTASLMFTKMLFKFLTGTALHEVESSRTASTSSEATEGDESLNTGEWSDWEME